MQLVLDIDNRAQILSQINQLLRQHYTPPDRYLLLDPVSQLVMSLIGGRTRSEVSKTAFLLLKQRFGTWAAVRDAPISEIEETICAVTYWNVKAPRLKATLVQITCPDGTLSLDHLSAFSVHDAHAWLERLPGVGRKVVKRHLVLRDKATPSFTRLVRWEASVGLRPPGTSQRTSRKFSRSGVLFCQ